MIIIPEAPEVEVARRSLENKLVGAVVENVEIRFDKIIKQQTVEVFLSRIVGCKFAELNRRGKYLIAPMYNPDYKNELYLIVHYGMTGALFNVKELDDIIPEYRNHVHVILTLSTGYKLVYCDIRKFGGLRIFTCEEYPLLGPKMGPEPFSDDAEGIFIKNVKKKLFKNKKDINGNKVKFFIPIKEAILDQSIIAGIGNIYANEALFESKIRPDTPINCLSDGDLSRVFIAARDIMKFSISVGGSSISDYVDGNGKRGKMQDYLKVYNKTHCPNCEAKIIKIDDESVGGRSTYYCDNCQE